MQLSVETVGFEQATKYLAQGVVTPVERAVKRASLFMERTAKDNITESVYSVESTGMYKRTRKARQSIVKQPLGRLSAKVYMGVNYGKYLEEGTGEPVGHKAWITNFGGQLSHPVLMRGMKARPFWQPAVESTQKETPKILKEELNKHFLKL